MLPRQRIQRVRRAHVAGGFEARDFLEAMAQRAGKGECRRGFAAGAAPPRAQARAGGEEERRRGERDRGDDGGERNGAGYWRTSLPFTSFTLSPTRNAVGAP